MLKRATKLEKQKLLYKTNYGKNEKQCNLNIWNQNFVMWRFLLI